jgi:hypothetical protein
MSMELTTDTISAQTDRRILTYAFETWIRVMGQIA